ncbi:DUF4129 domain-containing protein, partial [bacterium]|nr:DUF4129 domain-containing protein [bacterium]
SDETLEVFREDDAFNYNQTPDKVDTIVDRVKLWFWKMLRRIPFNGFFLFWKILPYLILTFAVAFVVSRLMKTDIKGLFYRSGTTAKLEFSEVEEDIHEMDFRRLIDEAVAQKKFRRAVRLFYLSILKELTDKELISWKIEKTNHDYLNELDRPELRRPFAGLTDLFEYVWYGNVSLDNERFENAAEKFKSFRLQLEQMSG